ncbi:MAG: FISUMP domain-containing protein [Paludibacter sp.]|nr:FISUMP domain-containing protein [Paludibacter sp.]
MKSFYYPLFYFIGFIFLLTACNSSDDSDFVPVLSTTDATTVTETTAETGGTISSNGGYAITTYGVCWSSSTSSPTIADNTSIVEGKTSSFSCTITGLTGGTIYYIRAYATNAKGTGYGSAIKITTIDPAEDITDNDGNTIKIVNIGTQTWMAENLKNLKYRNGELISNLTSATDWSNATFGACCYYDNDITNAEYGLLYNWNAVNDSRNIAPVGWHVATHDDWTTLINYLGTDSAGTKLKELGFDHWSATNTEATNSSGFTALPGGLRNTNGSFGDINDIGYWWTSTEYDTNDARYWYLNSNKIDIHKDYDSKMYGYSVRCVKDKN